MNKTAHIAFGCPFSFHLLKLHSLSSIIGFQSFLVGLFQSGHKHVITVVPYLQAKRFKIRSECLKPQKVPNLIYTVFFLWVRTYDKV